MKKAITIFCILLSLVYCKKESNPTVSNEIDGKIYLDHTGITLHNAYEFLVINNYDRSIWYFGLEENFPFFLVEYYANNQWNDSGLKYSEAHGSKIEFASGDSVSFNMSKPGDYKTWRIGVPIYLTLDSELKYKWSGIVNEN